MNNKFLKKLFHAFLELHFSEPLLAKILAFQQISVKIYTLWFSTNIGDNAKVDRFPPVLGE